MAKSTKVILTGLVPIVNSLLTKNTPRVKKCIDKFINERNQFIFDTCPCDRIYYTEADADLMFSAVGIDRETVRKHLQGTYYFAMAAFNPRAAKDELTVLVMCAIRYYYIVKKDMKTNILYVSKGYDPQTAYKQEFKVKDFHTLTAPLPLNAEVTFKIRHTPEYHPATIEPTGDGEFIVHSSKPIHGVAPGQFCVVYDQQHHRCYGSGEITL